MQITLKQFEYYLVRLSSFLCLKKQPTCRDVTSSFPAKWRLRNDRRNSILMTRHYPDLGCMCSWLAEANFQPIKSNTQIKVETSHQYGILALVPQTSFCGEMVGGFAKCRLFSQVDCKPNTYPVPLTQCFEIVPSQLVSWGLWKISNIKDQEWLSRENNSTAKLTVTKKTSDSSTSKQTTFSKYTCTSFIALTLCSNDLNYQKRPLQTESQKNHKPKHCNKLFNSPKPIVPVSWCF